MATIMIPEAAAQVIAVTNGAIARMGENRIPWFVPRQVKVGAKECVGLKQVGNNLEDLYRQKVRIFGGGITVIATVLSWDCGQTGWAHDPVKLVIRFGGNEWLFKSGWIRPVLVKTAARAHAQFVHGG